MEQSKDKLIEKEPLHWKYSKLMEVVYLSLCRKENVDGAIEAPSFNSLYPDSGSRAKKEAELGTLFDDEMIYMVTCLMATRQRSVILDMGTDTGINNDNEFYWEEKLMNQVKHLKRTKALSRGLTFDIVKAPLDSHDDDCPLGIDNIGPRQQPAVDHLDEVPVCVRAVRAA